MSDELIESDEHEIVDDRLKEVAVVILDAIASGADEISICKQLNITRGRFVKWVVDYPDFENALKVAKEMRADIYKSKVVSLALHDNGSVIEHDKENVPGVKANFDMLKWLASVDNPEKYGQRIKHDGNITQPTQIIIETGVSKAETDVEVEQEIDTSDLL